jgi:hypothetical protein
MDPKPPHIFNLLHYLFCSLFNFYVCFTVAVRSIDRSSINDSKNKQQNRREKPQTGLKNLKKNRFADTHHHPPTLYLVDTRLIDFRRVCTQINVECRDKNTHLLGKTGDHSDQPEIWRSSSSTSECPTARRGGGLPCRS